MTTLHDAGSRATVRGLSIQNRVLKHIIRNLLDAYWGAGDGATPPAFIAEAIKASDYTPPDGPFKVCSPAKVAKYKGVRPPKCNSGRGCPACNHKYRVAQRELKRKKPTLGLFR